MRASIIRKIVWRVVLPLAALIVLSSIDRVNVSFAALRMNADLGLDPKAYGFGVGIFFAGYLLFQLPSASVLRGIGPRRWIATSVIGWGLAATAMAFVTQPLHFYALRFMLGMFESGFAPGVVWFVSQWLPQAYRARAVGLTLLAIPLSVIIGGPLSGALLALEVDGVASWRIMFAVEGIATVIAGIAALRWFSDSPAVAPWLAPDERATIIAALESERGKGDLADTAPLLTVLRDPLLWLSAVVWFVLITGANAIIFWLPIAIKSFGRHDPFEIGVLSALPWIAIGAGMFFNARRSDRTGERFWHLALPMVLAAVALAAAALASGNGVLALAALIVGGFGLGGAQSVFWAIPTQLRGARHPGSIAAINLVGNASGAVVPIVIGWVVANTGSIAIPVYGLAALLLAGAVVVVPLRRGMMR
jgi:ACS family tartrate transporter-like MFS transporter